MFQQIETLKSEFKAEEERFLDDLTIKEEKILSLEDDVKNSKQVSFGKLNI